MIPLVIGPAERAVLRNLVARATASPIDHATLQAMAAASRDPDRARALRAMNQALTVAIPTAFTVTLTVEEQTPGALWRHLSVGCVTRPGRGPSPAAVAMVMEAVGFINPLDGCVVWREPLEDQTVAINVTEPLDGIFPARAGGSPPPPASPGSS